VGFGFVPTKSLEQEKKWQQDLPYESSTYIICSNVPVILGRMGETFQLSVSKTFAQPVQKAEPSRVYTPKFTGTLEHLKIIK
jgi:hypothetical protein